MIVSSIRGRVRLRSASFKDPDFPIKDILGLEGVLRAVHNPRTCSLLVEYDPQLLNQLEAACLLEKLDPGAVEEYLENLESQKAFFEKFTPGFSGKDSKSEMVSLVFTLLTLVATGFTKSKRLHIMVGMFFVEMVAQHIYRYRNRFFEGKKSKGQDPKAFQPITIPGDGQPKIPYHPDDPPIITC